MNKVICDVCGTAYPETANQCPICGCAKVSTQAAAVDTGAEETTAYSYVKGGRFSKKNVKARTQRGKFQDSGKSSSREPEEEKTNKGLVAVVVLLLIAIVAVVIYIGVQFFDMDIPGETTPSQSTQASDNTQASDSTTDSSDTTEITCTKLLLSNGTLEFLAAGDKWTLEVELEPVDCTEPVTFTSADPAVATVSETGEVVAVGPGETVITATCGAVTAECKVLCNFPGASEPTDPSESTGPAITDFEFKFNTRYVDDHTGYYDITLEQGITWRAYTSELTVEPEDITWVSDDPEICTVENGIVTITATGNTKVVSTKVHAEYAGKTFTCIVRVKPGEAPAPTEGEEGEGTDSSEPKAYKISSTDMTLKIDGYWWLKLQDSDGNTVEGVTWTADHEGYVKIEGNKLTGVKSTNDLSKKYVLVSCTYEGETYSCIVRVSGT